MPEPGSKPLSADLAIECSDSVTASASQTVLAFDFGLKRIGVAVGDAAMALAHPVGLIAFEDNRRRFDAIAALVEQWQPRCFVVGCPHGGDGGEHPLAAAIRRFARRLESRFGRPVILVDEHLSSWAAAHTLREAGVPARKHKPLLDAMAACAILETWFETRAGRTAAEPA